MSLVFPFPLFHPKVSFWQWSIAFLVGWPHVCTHMPSVFEWILSGRSAYSCLGSGLGDVSEQHVSVGLLPAVHSPFLFRLLIHFQPAEEKEQLLHNDEYQETMVESTFMYLTLDLPTAPLYKDEKEQLIIPQVPLFNILAKFNGVTEKVATLPPLPCFLGLYFNFIITSSTPFFSVLTTGLCK